jgi:hypothetical protein
MRKVIARKIEFGQAEHGVAWARSQLPAGTDVKLIKFPEAKNPNDYAIVAEPDRLLIQANSAVGACNGLLRLATQLRDGGKPRSVMQRFQFRTQNYKTESGVLMKYTDAAWEKVCQELVRHHFNGLVVYGGYHPFEYILDYSAYPEAVEGDPKRNDAYRARFNRLLEIAHQYGLTTFVHHYVGHFTQALANRYGIQTGGRLSNIEHPEVERYTRFCYRAIFEQCPDLDGLYFNFESYNNAGPFVVKTAIREANQMARKPVFVYRLWGVNDMEAVRVMYRAYRGRMILGHKISDTNDTYYLPVADSRVREWKKFFDPDVEWMFLVGPCHNCATNLCDQVWADYAFVQNLLADAKRKGADSISFHSVHMMFANEADDGTIFGPREKDSSTFNFLHLLAAADFAAGRRRSSAALAAILAARAGVPEKAGRALLEALTQSSRIVLLGYQQFCLGSNRDGFLLPHRTSLIQEPFLYMPASERNDQHTSLTWHNLINAWVAKRLPAKVAPSGTYQYIIDYVNPAVRKTSRNPAAIVRLLEASCRASRAALKKYRRLAGDAAADRLQPYLDANAVLGDYVQGEIQAGIALYSVYFAASQAEIMAALRRSLKQLEALLPIVADPQNPACKSLRRVWMEKLDPTPTIARVRETLALLEACRLPVEAFRHFTDSHRCYNDIRRWVRPTRRHDEKHLACIERQLNAALAACRRSLASLAGTGDTVFTPNVLAWQDYLISELVRIPPPMAVCGAEPAAPVLEFVHDDCFRAGENVAEDFLGFLKPLDYRRRSGITARVWRTDEALVVSVREDGISYAAREARWEQFKNDGSSISHVTRIFLDVGRTGVCSDAFTVRPKGSVVGRNREPIVDVPTSFEQTDTSWQTTVRIPFALLGRKPEPGEVWGFNITANPAVDRNCAYTWAAQNDMLNAPRFGRLRFA